MALFNADCDLFTGLTCHLMAGQYDSDKKSVSGRDKQEPGIYNRQQTASLDVLKIQIGPGKFT